MSKERIEEIACPKCHEKSRFTIHESINVTLDKDMKEKVLTGKAFSFKCPKCGKETMINYSFLYHDMENKYMIYELLNKEDPKELNEDPNFKSLFKEYTLRVVRDHNKLIEKIRIFDDKLDDLIIEALKTLVLTKANEEDMKNMLSIFYDGKDEKCIHYIIFMKDNIVKSCDVPLEAYNTVKSNNKFKYPKGFSEVSETNFDEFFQK